jgi:drug/metabolite transporter (DMT)-like permease
MVNYVIVLSVFCSSLAQVCLKKGMLECDCHFALESSNITRLIYSLATTPFLIAGVSLHVAALISWLYVLKHVDLSYAYPFISLGFILVLLMSHFIFREHIGSMRIAGVLFMVVGIIMVGRSAS